MAEATSKNFQITNLTKRNVLDIPFGVIKEGILGKKYFLSLVFVGPTKTRELNNLYRKKDYATNILSFPLDKNNGEIFINLTKAESEKKKFAENSTEHLRHLFIHGLLHLKGFTHGSKMESEEKKFLKKYSADEQEHHHRFGYRNKLDQTSRLRTKKRR